MKELDLGKGNIKKIMLTFCIPTIISMLINSIYNIVDQIFIGQGVGYLGNGATNVIFPLVVIATGFSLLIGNGTGAFMSLNLGEKDFKECKNGLGDSITVITIVSLLVGILTYIFLPQLVNLFGCTPDIYDYAIQYGRIISIGIPFMMISIALSDIIRVDGSPRYAMVATLSGAILNIILDPIFINKLNLKVEGAAYATLISQIISFIISIAYLFRIKSIKLELKDLKVSKSIFKIMSYGVSSFITQINIMVVMVLMNNLLTKYGALSIYGENIPISVYGIVMKASQIITSIIVGTCVGTAAIVGFNYGAGKFDRVREVFKLTIKVCITTGLIGTVMFELFPKQIISIFGTGNELYMDFAIKSMRICLALTVLNAFQIVSVILLQNLGRAKKSIMLSVIRQIVLLVPIAIGLGAVFGLFGVLFSAPVADALAFIISSCVFTYEYKNLEKTRADVNL